jgi:hypothetical protein
MKEKMNEKRWKQKTFSKCKIFSNFSQRKISFFFSIFLRFHTAKIKEFCSTTRYLFSKCTAKTYEPKDFSLASDEKTHSSNKEENVKRFYFIFI